MTNRLFVHRVEHDCVDDSPVGRLHTDYILSTNERGSAVIHKMMREFTGSLAGKRVLDIGSGYGGICIAAAEAGAEAVGIELSDYQRELAALNLADHPGLNATFHCVDATDRNEVTLLGRFDLITCDNVIEHVDSTTKLLSNIAHLLSQEGYAYLTVPNGFSVGQVLEDCHYKLLGITLLDRWDAQAYFNQTGHADAYGVGDYYPYETYLTFFERFGLRFTSLLPIDTSEPAIHSLTRRVHGLLGAAASLSGDDRLTRKIRDSILRYVSEFQAHFTHWSTETDPERRERCARAIQNTYGVELWYFVLQRQ